MTAKDSSRLQVSAPTGEALYQELRLALARFEDRFTEEPMRATAWAAAAKALEYLEDERSIADALAVAHRAIDRGDVERALLVVLAIAGRLQPDSSALVRLGDRACSAGLLDVVCAVARELRRVDIPVPAAWAETPPGESRRDLTGELLQEPEDGISRVTGEAQVRGAEPFGPVQVHPVRDALREAFRCIEGANARGAAVTGTPTGFDAYDRLTSGLHDGELTVVAGHRGMGTTSLVLGVAVNVASPQELETAMEPRVRWLETGHGVLLFTPGTSRRQTVTRILCAEARVDVDVVRTGMLTSRDWEQLTQAAGRLAALRIWVNDTPDLSPGHIRRVADRLQAEFDACDHAGNRTQRLGLIVIDGCRHLRGGRRALRRLRDLARDLMVPIIVTIALDPMASDPKGGKRPQLSDLPLSDDDADNVCFLHRDSYYDRDADPEVVQLIVASQRSGPTDSVRLRWQPQYGRIDNLPQGEHDE